MEGVRDIEIFQTFEEKGMPQRMPVIEEIKADVTAR
jgi:hypothetical protein